MNAWRSLIVLLLLLAPLSCQSDRFVCALRWQSYMGATVLEAEQLPKRVGGFAAIRGETRKTPIGVAVVSQDFEVLLIGLSGWRSELNGPEVLAWGTLRQSKPRVSSHGEHVIPEGCYYIRKPQTELRSQPPIVVTHDEAESLKGGVVTVEGIARHDRGGAVLWGEHLRFWPDKPRRWAPEELGRRAQAIGVLNDPPESNDVHRMQGVHYRLNGAPSITFLDDPSPNSTPPDPIP